jgi:hypothetical protein
MNKLTKVLLLSLASCFLEDLQGKFLVYKSFVIEYTFMIEKVLFFSLFCYEFLYLYRNRGVFLDFVSMRSALFQFRLFVLGC